MMKGYGDRTNSCSEVVHLLNDQFLNLINSVSRFAVVRIIQLFNATDSVEKKPKRDIPVSISEEKLLDVLHSFYRNIQ